jgi:two-component system response regulator AtoC
MNTKILVVEDEPEVRDYLGFALKEQGYATDFAEDGEEAMSILRQPSSDVGLMLLDIIMPRKDGLDTLREARQLTPGLPIVMLSGSSSTTDVIQAMKSGADDFLQKPISYDDLGAAIEKVLRSNPDSLDESSLVTPVRDEVPFSSNWAHKIEKFLDDIGESEVPVLLRGETGVGKEVVARQLHARSPRRDKPFLKVNCAALPSELIESELFGYERGAFTGAFKASEGRFKQADGGTIFLDEIGDMDVKLQAKLLQVLQDQEFLRLGSKETTRVNVRVMAATHCDLEQAMTDGRFREDLYYRLNVINVYIPALRERKDEILGLAEHLLRKHSNGSKRMPKISPSLRQALVDHPWPGNIRELENVMRQLLVVQDSEMVLEELQRRQLRQLRGSAARSVGASPSPVQTPPAAFAAAAASSFGSGAFQEDAYPRTAPMGSQGFVPALDHNPAGENLTPPSPHTLDRVDEYRKNAEANVILSALKTTRWNRRQAADLLKIDYKALLYKMKKLNIGA